MHGGPKGGTPGIRGTLLRGFFQQKRKKKKRGGGREMTNPALAIQGPKERGKEGAWQEGLKTKEESACCSPPSLNFPEGGGGGFVKKTKKKRGRGGV